MWMGFASLILFMCASDAPLGGEASGPKRPPIVAATNASATASVTILPAEVIVFSPKIPERRTKSGEALRIVEFQ